MSRDILSIPEELLPEVIRIIRSGILINQISSKPTIKIACDLLEEWVSDMEEDLERKENVSSSPTLFPPT